MLIHLKIESWVGTSAGAVHSYGELIGSKTIVLKKKIKKNDLKNLNNRKDDFLNCYRVGSLTKRFDTEEEIIKLAIETYKKHFKKATVLCLGDNCHHEPKKILDAAKGIKGKANIIFRRAKRLGFYEHEKNDDIMDKLTTEWYKIIGIKE